MGVGNCPGCRRCVRCLVVTGLLVPQYPPSCGFVRWWEKLRVGEFGWWFLLSRVSRRRASARTGPILAGRSSCPDSAKPWRECQQAAILGLITTDRPTLRLAVLKHSSATRGSFASPSIVLALAQVRVCGNETEQRLTLIPDLVALAHVALLGPCSVVVCC